VGVLALKNLIHPTRSVGVQPITKLAVGYAAVAVTMVLLDMLWLGVVAKPLYREGIGHLMAGEPKLLAALLFYLLYALGLMVFVVTSDRAVPPTQRSFGSTMRRGALFGLVCYATYDLSNLATLKDWPATLALIDIAWGSALSAVCSASGKLALGRLA
jgi:uncharacterized membrane protein